jgi:hypothetical protein
MENTTKFPVDPGTRPFKPLCIHQPDMVPFGDVPLYQPSSLHRDVVPNSTA